jgi:hypothetical protein
LKHISKILAIILSVSCLLFGIPGIPDAAPLLSDEPEHPPDSTLQFKAAGSYGEALRIWKSPEDIAGWIAANFSYDMARVLRLSETGRADKDRTPIYDPSEFFDAKTGVCVDLSRFGVETLRRIDPAGDPKYLMIEFEPIRIQGHMLRRHWLVSFKRDGKIYFFADSKRPGYIAGPYNDTAAFIKEYEEYRGRKIVAYRELDSYQRQRQTKALKTQTTKKP